MTGNIQTLDGLIVVTFPEGSQDPVTGSHIIIIFVSRDNMRAVLYVESVNIAHRIYKYA